jgi:nitrogen regulatory protein P-II 1
LKMIHAVIRPERLEEVKNALEKAGFHGLTVYDVMGRGRQQGFSWRIRGNTYKIDLLPKVKIEIVVGDEDAQRVVEIIKEAAATGEVGDGKIFITPVDETIRIRTGERGPEAVK